MNSGNTTDFDFSATDGEMSTDGTYREEFGYSSTDNQTYLTNDYYYYYYNGYYEYYEYLLQSFDFEILLQGRIRPALVFLTMFANLLVISYFAGNRSRRRRPANVLFVSIALSDMMTGLFLLPNSFRVYSGDEEIFLSLTWCKIFMLTKFYISPVFHTVSIWQTVLLGTQRYVCICYPFLSRKLCTLRQTLLSIAVMYVSALLLHMYHFLRMFKKLDTGTCEWVVEWPCDKTCIYLWFCVILMHIMPCAILLVLTCITLLRLKRATKSLSRISANFGKGRHGRDRVITITALLVVVVFLVPELPHGIYKLVLAINVQQKRQLLHDDVKVNHLIISIYEILLLVSFHANFWIYCLMMREFRGELKGLVSCNTLQRRFSRVRSFSATTSSRRCSESSRRTRLESIESRKIRLHSQSSDPGTSPVTTPEVADTTVRYIFKSKRISGRTKRNVSEEEYDSVFA